MKIVATAFADVTVKVAVKIVVVVAVVAAAVVWCQGHLRELW